MEVETPQTKQIFFIHQQFMKQNFMYLGDKAYKTVEKDKFLEKKTLTVNGCHS